MEVMLNKNQILERLDRIIKDSEVANKKWVIEQLEGLISSANSPEIFHK